MTEEIRNIVNIIQDDYNLTCELQEEINGDLVFRYGLNTKALETIAKYLGETVGYKDLYIQSSDNLHITIKYENRAVPVGFNIKDV